MLFLQQLADPAECHGTPIYSPGKLDRRHELGIQRLEADFVPSFCYSVATRVEMLSYHETWCIETWNLPSMRESAVRPQAKRMSDGKAVAANFQHKNSKYA